MEPRDGVADHAHVSAITRRVSGAEHFPRPFLDGSHEEFAAVLEFAPCNAHPTAAIAELECLCKPGRRLKLCQWRAAPSKHPLGGLKRLYMTRLVPVAAIARIDWMEHNCTAGQCHRQVRHYSGHSRGQDFDDEDLDSDVFWSARCEAIAALRIESDAARLAAVWPSTETVAKEAPAVARTADHQADHSAAEDSGSDGPLEDDIASSGACR